jgi:hypothetical protein
MLRWAGNILLRINNHILADGWNGGCEGVGCKASMDSLIRNGIVYHSFYNEIEGEMVYFITIGDF